MLLDHVIHYGQAAYLSDWLCNIGTSSKDTTHERPRLMIAVDRSITV